MATGIARSEPLNGDRAMIYAPVTLDKASTDVAEKSNPPFMTVNVTPSAIIKRSVTCKLKLVKFLVVAKFGTNNTAKTKIITTAYII